MKTIRTKTLFALVLVAGVVLLNFSLAAASEVPARSGKLHLIKDTSEYTGLPGGFATIVSTNLTEVPVGSKLFYDQVPDIPTGLIDSSVVLDAGNGNRAVGRCTTDLVTWIGLCTFWDGMGTLAGFHARLDISAADEDFIQFHMRGTYRFARHGKGN
jgi:hypothetical protein